MPRKIERLKREALEACTFRGHVMSRFTTSQNRKFFYSECKKEGCNAQVCVTPHPMPHEIDIGGEAVALNCHGKGA